MTCVTETEWESDFLWTESIPAINGEIWIVQYCIRLQLSDYNATWVTFGYLRFHKDLSSSHSKTFTAYRNNAVLSKKHSDQVDCETNSWPSFKQKNELSKFLEELLYTLTAREIKVCLINASDSDNM